MTDILLVTLNSTYSHSSFGLRYLMANLKEYQAQAQILEYTIAKEPRDIVESLLKLQPKIVGFGVYIWNAEQTLEIVSILKKVSPQTIVVLGGPEVSHEAENQKICQIADFTIQGEADFLFYQFCDQYFKFQKLPEQKIVRAIIPEIKEIALPYALYSDDDIRNRTLYVEISRGCPYRCEYCLSSLDKSVRSFDIPQFLKEMDLLIQRGARQFKFIDRTFNLSPQVCTQVMEFFLERMDLGLFLHFEMVPDRLPPEIKELIKKFPKGSLQFEIGIQTWNVDVARRVSRRNDLVKVKENFHFLATETGVHSHADLIVGLPGEDLESFAEGFDTLHSLAPDEIQVGILKRLKGAPIARHDLEWEMVYHDAPPFQILKTKTMDYPTLQIMNRFAKYWDLYANSGNFHHFMKLLKEESQKREDKSFFKEFFEFNHFVSNRFAQHFAHALLSLTEAAYVYLVDFKKVDSELARQTILQDYTIDGKRDVPRFLKEGLHPAFIKPSDKNLSEKNSQSVPKRQQKHLSK